ncbi:hypothetical protein ACLOJK_026161 [Asimina triloba]
MAGTTATPEMEKAHQDRADRLKYLDFVQIAGVRAVGILSNVYGYAKENSGPLKDSVQTMEGRVRTVISPVYEKFQDVPLEILKFADRKVDGLMQEVDRRVPVLVKVASNQALSAVQTAPVLARAVASEVQRAGMVETATGIARTAYGLVEPTAKELYARYEPVAEQCAVVAWQSVNRLPLVPEVADVVMPTAAYCSEKYNRAVCYTAERGYTVSAYLPLIPTERIAKVFAAGRGTDADAEEESSPLVDAPIS